MSAELNDLVKITNGEFSMCSGRIVSLVSFLATIRITHSNGVLLRWPRQVTVHVGDCQRIAE